jgi:hypothetical protein
LVFDSAGGGWLCWSDGQRVDGDELVAMWAGPSGAEATTPGVAVAERSADLHLVEVGVLQEVEDLRGSKGHVTADRPWSVQ